MSNRRKAGFTLLEAMLAILVLLVGIMALAPLSKSVLGNLSPSGGVLLEHSEIVEHLLRDQAELIRAHPDAPAWPSAYPTIPPLALAPASYSVAVDAIDYATGSFAGITYAMATYSIEVRQGPGAHLVGRTLLTRLATLSEMIPAVGRVGY